MKEAVDKLNKETSFSKKDIYNASLNIYRVGASTLSGEFVRPTKVG